MLRGLRLAGMSLAFVAACKPAPSSNVPLDKDDVGLAEEAAQSDPDAPAPDPAATLDAIESAALDGDRSVRFSIEATGAVEVKVVGLLRVAAGRVTVEANGSFAGQPIELSLEADGERMRGGGSGPKFDLPEAKELRAALMIGLVRMGALHNVAVLMGGRPPDHADGGVREWVVADSPRLEVAKGMSPPDQISANDVVSFELVVAGEPSGTASVWFDARSGLPLARQQIVDFPDGQMRVRETYDWDV